MTTFTIPHYKNATLAQFMIFYGEKKEQELRETEIDKLYHRVVYERKLKPRITWPQLHGAIPNKYATPQSFRNSLYYYIEKRRLALKRCLFTKGSL